MKRDRKRLFCLLSFFFFFFFGGKTFFVPMYPLYSLLPSLTTLNTVCPARLRAGFLRLPRAQRLGGKGGGGRNN